MISNINSENRMNFDQNGAHSPFINLIFRLNRSLITINMSKDTLQILRKCMIWCPKRECPGLKTLVYTHKMLYKVWLSKNKVWIHQIEVWKMYNLSCSNTSQVWICLLWGPRTQVRPHFNGWEQTHPWRTPTFKLICPNLTENAYVLAQIDGWK